MFLLLQSFIFPSPSNVLIVVVPPVDKNNTMDTCGIRNELVFSFLIKMESNKGTTSVWPRIHDCRWEVASETVLFVCQQTS